MPVNISGKFRSGKNARITVGSTNLSESEYDVTSQADDIDTTNFESAQGGVNSYDEGIVGVLGANCNAAGNWDAGKAAFATVPGIYPRDDLAACVFYTNLADNVAFNFPYLRVLSVAIGAQAKSTNAVSVKWSGKSNGTFSNPNTSV